MSKDAKAKDEALIVYDFAKRAAASDSLKELDAAWMETRLTLPEDFAGEARELLGRIYDLRHSALTKDNWSG